jgi:hypothetical protein
MRYFVHLVIEGRPPRKARNTAGTTIVSLDRGPSTVAICAANEVVEPDGVSRVGPVTNAVLMRFCGTLDDHSVVVRRLLRKADRQLRASNPGNYRRTARSARNARPGSGPRDTGRPRPDTRRSAAENPVNASAATASC